MAAALLCPGKALAWEPASVIWHSGGMIVHILEDRPGSMDIALFSGPASEAERAAFFTDGKSPAAISAFLIRKDGKNILVDAGFGDAVPGVSALTGQLASLEITPDKVDVVLLTHMHSDHVGGLLREGKRVFPKASVLVCDQELAYWLSLEQPCDNSANAALVRRVKAAYGDDLRVFAFGADLLPGIEALDASGHTPGHTVLRLKGDGKDLLILGDLIHAAALQFPLPDECAVYDMDREKATTARKAILDMAASEKTPVAGMHLPYPGAGLVQKEGQGYRYEAFTLTLQPQ